MPIVSALAAVAARGYGFLQGRFSDFELIETQTVGAGGAASITFNSIPGTYKHLQIRSIQDLSTSGDLQITMTGATFAKRHYIIGNAATATIGNDSSNSWLSLPLGSSFGAAIVDIVDYTNTSKNKTLRSFTGFETNSSGQTALLSGLYTSTAVITAITITASTGTIDQHSTFSLYGVK